MYAVPALILIFSISQSVFTLIVARRSPRGGCNHERLILPERFELSITCGLSALCLPIPPQEHMMAVDILPDVRI